MSYQLFARHHGAAASHVLTLLYYCYAEFAEASGTLTLYK